MDQYIEFCRSAGRLAEAVKTTAKMVLGTHSASHEEASHVVTKLGAQSLVELSQTARAAGFCEAQDRNMVGGEPRARSLGRDANFYYALENMAHILHGEILALDYDIQPHHRGEIAKPYSDILTNIATEMRHHGYPERALE